MTDAKEWYVVGEHRYQVVRYVDNKQGSMKVLQWTAVSSEAVLPIPRGGNLISPRKNETIETDDGVRAVLRRFDMPAREEKRAHEAVGGATLDAAAGSEPAMGKSAAQHLSEVGNYGDGREHCASTYLEKNAPPNDPDAALAALEEFDVRWTMLHLGKEKGEHLDRAVREVLSERIRSLPGATSSCDSKPMRPIRAMEIGAYIGYSAIRIGKILAEASKSSTLRHSLLTVEQNEENAVLAKKHVDYAGLGAVVTVVNARIEECFTGDEDETGPYDFVFIDHRKPYYLRDLQILESLGIIDRSITTVVADNVASLEHVRNREASIARGKRKGLCKCVNKACDYLQYVRKHWGQTEVYYGADTKDGISVSTPSR